MPLQLSELILPKPLKWKIISNQKRYGTRQLIGIKKNNYQFLAVVLTTNLALSHKTDGHDLKNPRLRKAPHGTDETCGIIVKF